MHRSIVWTALSCALVAAVVACTNDAPVESFGASTFDTPQVWGGAHVRLTASDSTVRLEYDCAYGAMDGVPRVGRDGRFAATGTHVLLHGGPLHPGEVEDRHPAAYAGEQHGDVITLRVRLLDRDLALGPFTLRRGDAGTLFTCL